MYQNHVPCSFAYRLVRVDDKFTKPIVVFRGENAAYEFITAILKDWTKVMKKRFNKILSWAKKKNNFSPVTLVGFVKNSLMMTMKKLEIIGTLLEHLEAQLIGVVTFVSSIN